jgi:hypothetical protein
MVTVAQERGETSIAEVAYLRLSRRPNRMITILEARGNAVQKDEVGSTTTCSSRDIRIPFSMER